MKIDEGMEEGQAGEKKGWDFIWRRVGREDGNGDSREVIRDFASVEVGGERGIVYWQCFIFL